MQSSRAGTSVRKWRISLAAARNSAVASSEATRTASRTSRAIHPVHRASAAAACTASRISVETNSLSCASMFFRKVVQDASSAASARRVAASAVSRRPLIAARRRDRSSSTSTCSSSSLTNCSSRASSSSFPFRCCPEGSTTSSFAASVVGRITLHVEGIGHVGSMVSSARGAPKWLGASSDAPAGGGAAVPLPGPPPGLALRGLPAGVLAAASTDRLDQSAQYMSPSAALSGDSGPRNSLSVHRQ
mmetsp:Transcript_72344/g.204452  ORF Transcript_72344/g.204452 Transcript_72344/m.204452 type:complete len:246 (-) Transcript_72344:97-834(-)